MSKENIFKKEISNYLDDASPSNIHLYWKGRVALYAILKAASIGMGDEVILPAYTCVVVPNAIIYTGATPVYVDVDFDSFNANMQNIERAITPNTKAIICQNTFGLSSQVNEIAMLAKEKNILSIEDCTHGFGGKFNDNYNGTYCDAAFFSTQWNKPFSTGVGGFSFIKNDALNEKVISQNKNLCKPSLVKKASLSLQLFMRKTLLTDRTYWVLVPLYRMLSKKNIVLGSSSGLEITSADEPKNYLMAMSNVQINSGIKNIKKLPDLLKIRKTNAAKYTRLLSELGLNHPQENLSENHAFLKYPVLVKERLAVMTLAEKHKISLGDWLNSPLHPIQKDFETWKMNVNDFPNAKFAGEHMINLPLESGVDKAVKFIEIIKEHIYTKQEIESMQKT